MVHKNYLVIGIGTIAGGTAYLYYPEIGLPSALMLVFGISFFLWRMTGVEKAMNTIALFKNPPLATFMIFLGCFLYLSLQSYSSANTWLYSSGIALLGGLISVILNNIWNLS